MKRLTTFIVLTAFLSCQTAAYGQQAVSFPSSAMSNVDGPQRKINVYKVVDPEVNGYRDDRDSAMSEAIMEAEFKEIEEREARRRQERLKGPMRGKREERIIRTPGRERTSRMEGSLDSGKGDGAESKKRLKKIKIRGNIPKNADLGEGIVRKINEKIYPVKISGDYQMSWGYDDGDENNEGQRGIWKSADFNEANLVYVLDNQYIFGRERENTYDKRVFSRFRMKIETVRKTGFNILTETVIDPWSFVGKTDSIVVTGSNGNQLPLQLRYWSNTQSTIDQRSILSSGGDFVNIPNIGVNDDSTHHTRIASRWAGEVFDIPPMDINRDFRPMRKLEANYTDENFIVRAFALADQERAYTSDDPLILSNQHTYWEPSPWLRYWDPAVYYGPSNDFIRGQWRDDIPFESRDSDFNFLTLLRGLSFEFNFEDFYIGGATAAPLTLWQDYASVNSLPGAIRLKQRLFADKRTYVGGVYTYNYGFDGGHLDAYNHVFGIDAGYEIPETFSFRGEVAWSHDKLDNNGNDPNITDLQSKGTAVKFESKGEFFKDRGGNPQLRLSSSFTHMGDGFRPRLSNYRNTRYDEFWGKHISFETVDPNFNAFRIGTGVDVGRDVYHFRMENMFFEGKLNSLYDMRFVRGDDRKIEDVYRGEITVRPIKNVIGKALLRYQDLPRTTLNTDPFIINDFISRDNTDDFLLNTDIPSGEETDVWTWSLGLHYDPTKWLGVEGIYERSNDYDTFPNRVLNDAGFIDLGDTRELTYFLYGQPLIAAPPYQPYNVYKGRLYYRPFDRLRTKFEYVINTFKHATGRDDNISHWGIEVDCDITDRLTGSFKYIRSQVVDLFMQQQRQADVPFNHHNNIFAELRYDIDSNNTFIVSFGEFFVPTRYTPVPWILNTLDTQRIVRLYLKGKF